MNIQAQIDKAERVIEKLEAELAESKKPKLRDGDYGRTVQIHGVDSGVRSFIFVGGCVYYNTGTYDEGMVLSDGRFYEYIVLGNIFDDLKARQEPLKKFEIGNGSFQTIQVELEDSGLLKLRDKDGYMVIKETEIPKLILNLQRVVYTAEASK